MPHDRAARGEAFEVFADRLTAAAAQAATAASSTRFPRRAGVAADTATRSNFGVYDPAGSEICSARGAFSYTSRSFLRSRCASTRTMASSAATKDLGERSNTSVAMWNSVSCSSRPSRYFSPMWASSLPERVWRPSSSVTRWSSARSASEEFMRYK